MVNLYKEGTELISKSYNTRYITSILKVLMYNIMIPHTIAKLNFSMHTFS